MDSTHNFEVAYPVNFVLRPQAAEAFSFLIPTPVTVWRIINPTLAASDLGDAEPADLEIRVYPAGKETSLDAWLTSSEKRQPDSATASPFQTQHISGVELCSTTLMAPSCSYLTLSGDWVYELLPVTLEGEMMMDSFLLSK